MSEFTVGQCRYVQPEKGESYKECFTRQEGDTKFFTRAYKNGKVCGGLFSPQQNKQNCINNSDSPEKQLAFHEFMSGSIYDYDRPVDMSQYEATASRALNNGNRMITYKNRETGEVFYKEVKKAPLE